MRRRSSRRAFDAMKSRIRSRPSDVLMIVSSGGDLGVGVIRRLERELLAEPVAKPAMQLLVVAALVGDGSHPPADVHVVAEEILGQLSAPPHRIEVATAEVTAVAVADGVGEGVSLAELELMPHEVDVVPLLGDRLGRPAAAARSLNQLETRVDAPYVVV